MCEILKKIKRLLLKCNIHSKNKLYNTDKWDIRFLELACHISKWSKDPSTQVGAVIVDGRRIVSLGFNGFPQGVEDTEERLNNRELKYKMVIHAEENAILFAREPLLGYTIYVWPFMTCPTCSSKVVQSGIKRVVAPYSDDVRRKDYYEIGGNTLREAGVKVDLVDINLIKEKE
jgi:dCMP deaminase